MRGSNYSDIEPCEYRELAPRLKTNYLPNIRVFTGPCTKGLKLALGLAHPCVEKVEFSQGLCTGLGIAVDRVKSIGRQKIRAGKERRFVRLIRTQRTELRTSCDVRRSRRGCVS